MRIKWYRHTSWGQFVGLFFKISAVLAVVMFTGFGVLVLASPIWIQDQAWSASTCMGIWSIGLSWVLGLTFFNLYPDVYTDLEGISISFMLTRCKIPWDDVLSIDIRGFAHRTTVVSAHKITPFHHVYGWLYKKQLQPCFLIADTLENREELIEEIERNIRLQR
jgi:hypothetical protein